MDSNRFFSEVTRICASQGITAGKINDGYLPMAFASSGSPICRISSKGIFTERISGRGSNH